MDKSAKTFVINLITLLLASLLIVPFVGSQPPLAQVTITADGSVVGTDKIQQNGNTYTLIDNLNASIRIEKDNVVLDGAGFALRGQLNETAVSLTNRANVNVENLNIIGFAFSIEIANSSNCIISENNFIDNLYGIRVDNSSNVWVERNTFKSTSSYSIGVFSENCKISNNIFINNSNGISVDGDFNEISGNLIIGGVGIIITSSYNVVIGNNITYALGIEIIGFSPEFDKAAKNNLISQNIFLYCGNAVNGYNEKNNLFFSNEFIGNGLATRGFNDDDNSTFFLNTFINNTRNVGFENEGYLGDTYTPTDIRTSHNWDNGTIGNYWSDYLTQNPTARGVGSTGTYDSPYRVTPATNYPYLFYDYHPLVNPVSFIQNEPVTPSWVTPMPTPIALTSDIQLIIVTTITALAILFVSLLLCRRHRNTANQKRTGLLKLRN
jgi:parallel beta-helix repeat protein